MLVRVNTFAIEGVDARPVWAEVDVRPGLPAFHILGLGDAAMREARERVRSALLRSGFSFPMRRVTARLAPAHARTVGPGFHATLAIGILAATRQSPVEPLEGFAVYGELTLAGELRPCRGTLAAAQAARREGLRGLIVPSASALEAAAVEGLQVAAVDDLHELVRVLAGGELPPLPPARPSTTAGKIEGPGLCEIRGQQRAVRALEIAAAGGHHLLLVGARGTGVTALARCLPGLLPPLSREEALEVTRIHSIAGLHHGDGLLTARPFRAPHHTITPIGLLGGGRPIRPGEATLSHRGVLLLDELTAFQRLVVQALRSATADGQLIATDSSGAVKLPTRFLLVATAFPCPGACRSHRCRCTATELTRYRTRICPLRDPFEMRVNVEAPDSSAARPPSTSEIRERVITAQAVLRESPSNPFGTLGGRELRLAKTIAALDGRDLFTPEDRAEAATYTTSSGW